MVIHTIDLISVIFFMHPYLIELICGSDMNMTLNHFSVFLYPNTPNFIRHKFLDSSFYLFFKDSEINVNIPNFCLPVYLSRTLVIILFFSIYINVMWIQWFQRVTTMFRYLMALLIQQTIRGLRSISGVYLLQLILPVMVAYHIQIELPR